MTVITRGQHEDNTHVKEALRERRSFVSSSIKENNNTSSTPKKQTGGEGWIVGEAERRVGEGVDTEGVGSQINITKTTE